jgi:hypothetical protein
VEAPQLRLTPEAKSALERQLASSNVAEPRATVLWASGGVRSFTDEAGKTHAESNGAHGWRVAVYSGVALAPGQKYEVGGVPFCVVQPNWTERLKGATLHWCNGKFEVQERAT